MLTEVSNFKRITLPQRWLAFIRHVGPYKGNTELFKNLFKQIYVWASSRNLLNPDSESITVYHDPPGTPEQQERISVGFTVPQGTLISDDIQLMELPAGDYVMGNLEILPEEYEFAWTEVMNYIQEYNLRVHPEGPAYESYKNDPRNHPEGKHIVDIALRLA